MTAEKVVIRIKGLRKKYLLGAIGSSTLRKALESWWAVRRGKEDPNLPIGSSPQIAGQSFWALNGIDLVVHQGERVGIIGLNGAGKSTLLKILSRVTAPTEGEIDIYGHLSSMLEIGMGFHGEMTGRENIYMNGAILGMSEAEINAKMADIIAFSEIGEYIDTPVKRYSSGMFVKLAFAVAAHLDSEIMVMDEVLAVGDMMFQQKCLAKMREISEKEERTILYVSHNMATIRTLCDRCIVLKQGKICFDGDVEQAIAVYMDEKQGSSAVFADLTGCTVYNRNFEHGIRFQKLSLTDENAPEYRTGEMLNMLLELQSTVAVQRLVARISFQTSDGLILASAESGEFDLPPGSQKLRLALPLSGVAKGSFKLSIALGTRPDDGRFRVYAQAERAIGIRARCANRWWNPAHQGYWMLPGLSVQAEEAGSDPAPALQPGSHVKNSVRKLPEQSVGNSI